VFSALAFGRYSQGKDGFKTLETTTPGQSVETFASMYMLPALQTAIAIWNENPVIGGISGTHAIVSGIGHLTDVRNVYQYQMKEQAVEVANGKRDKVSHKLALRCAAMRGARGVYQLGVGLVTYYKVIRHYGGMHH
jgi:hypothetical protein